ncbi:3'-to-5' oligoribonuclease B [Campylobacter sp. VBCF_06 NA8]|uniref:DHH family phosphoesterase n=1 Tax=Campylobacter sp. VBCF_06 NA8 TaxID=2983822 RepID=UPI0022E9CC8A|nr:DHH family phosphoesterase [Campylobacter sp. VBCF_06 NA8]MDA3046613.1 3'-to-5' oligoribonuclease B [Campylobacter sp. VBCF_06 NA8]
MKIYHLSHTDLDGYSAQLVVAHYLSGVEFFNANYGKEIVEKFDQILGKIDENLQTNPDAKSLVLITDLNLLPAQCEKFQTQLAQKNAKIFLLDHHQSGAECAQKHPWYLLDNSRCATKITYDFFSAIFDEDEELAKFVKVVNAVDIWLKDESEFELGKVCLGMVSNAKEINKIMFEEQSREYINFLLNKIFEFQNLNEPHIALDDALHAIKKSFFNADRNDTLSNLISDYVVTLLDAQKERFSIEYEGFKGILTYNIGNVSVIGNDFLTRNPDMDFFIDVTSKKTLSFRANGKVDVSAMAKNLLGGGGHANASGGIFIGFKDANSYEAIKSQIEQLINLKTQKADNEI